MDGLPSGKQPHNYGKSPCFMGKSTINGPFSIAMQLFYSHYLCGYPQPRHLHLRPLFRLRYPMDRQGTLQPNIIPTRLRTGLGICFPTTNIIKYPSYGWDKPTFFGTYILTYPRGSVNAIYIYGNMDPINIPQSC